MEETTILIVMILISMLWMGLGSVLLTRHRWDKDYKPSLFKASGLKKTGWALTLGGGLTLTSSIFLLFGVVGVIPEYPNLVWGIMCGNLIPGVAVARYG